ncbi:MAG: glycosyltransferase family 2 protein, partial [Bradyrhizobium sp.]
MPKKSAARPRYSLVVPIFNEEAVLPLLLHRLDQLLEKLDAPAEVIFVDDGSRDCSSIVLAARARDNPHYKYIRLSRNFGHQVAITAGMDRASGDAVIVMDADLQDPPELVLEMIAKWHEGFEIVYAERLTREGEGRFKKATANLFYRMLNKLASVDIPRNVGDFRLIDRKVLNAFSTMREKDRFVRGMFAWMGFKQTAVTFHRQPRAAGETKYPLRKMLRLAANGIISFSDAPLRLALWVGMGVSVLAMLYAAYVVAMWFTQAHLVPGWSST